MNTGYYKSKLLDAVKSAVIKENLRLKQELGDELFYLENFQDYEPVADRMEEIMRNLETLESAYNDLIKTVDGIS